MGRNSFGKGLAALAVATVLSVGSVGESRVMAEDSSQDIASSKVASNTGDVSDSSHRYVVRGCVIASVAAAGLLWIYAVGGTKRGEEGRSSYRAFW